MLGSQRNGVFLSYARADGEDFAASLRERLREKAPDIVIKQDRLLLEGGVGWWKQLTEAIDSVEFLILIMTPSAMESATVRKEWRYARQQGVCVYPVKRSQGSSSDFTGLPRWMNKSHFFDLDKEWETFLAHLRKGCDTPRVPFMAPDLPENFVQRPAEFGQLKDLLLSTNRKETVAVTTALSGAGGFGKTTLAAALCHDEEIIQGFDDGILWITLGQTPNLVGSLLTAYAALTGDRPGFANEEDAAFQLGQKLEDRTCLLVIDDVWDEAHLRPFLRGGKSCTRLFTTRNAEIASGAKPVNVDEMGAEESRALLSKGVPGLTASRSAELSQLLGEWPLALEIAGAMMRQRIAQGDTAENAAERLKQLLNKKGPGGLARGAGDPRHRTISSVIESSLELLSPQDRNRLIGLSIFPEDIAIPLRASAALWGLDDFESEEAAQRFARLYLLKLDLARGSMRLHDVMRSWFAASTTNSTQLHCRLVDAWPDRMGLPHTYAWRWLPWHLIQAGRHAELKTLLWNPAWLEAKLLVTETNAIIADFEYLKPSHEAELIQGALRLSSHVLAKYPEQFPSQLAGRLVHHAGKKAIQLFLTSISSPTDRKWLRPLWPALDPPGTALVRTLAGHSDRVTGVAISPDGRRALSASRDKIVKVWDLETGAELCKLTGHSGGVAGLAVLADGRRAVSASEDNTLKVWDLEKGIELSTLAGHSDWVVDVAVSADGRHAVSASHDKTLKVWDLETGTELRTLAGHSDRVTGVAVSANGQRAVSASEDKTLKVWDLETGAELCTLIGHLSSVTDVAFASGGMRVVSASNDGTLKVWDLETGTEVCTLAGHLGWVTGVAVTLDGMRAVSASNDDTLKVWNLETGAELRTLVGHTTWITGVATTPDGSRVVSASNDNTLKVWDLENEAELGTLAGHSKWINGVAATQDGVRAVSASDDRTLKVWNLETGEWLGTLVGHADLVTSVAITPDGRRAVSASGDTTLKVWDLETTAELGALAGHSRAVTGVAITTDGGRIVSASEDRTLKVWDLETGLELRTLTGHSGGVRCVAVTPDGRCAVSASNDNTLKVWDLEAGTEIRTLTGHLDTVTSVVVTPDGRRAVSASEDRTLRVWDLETGSELRNLAGHSEWVKGVTVTADGRYAASTSYDYTLKVWDLETGANSATFACDRAPQCCAFVTNRNILVGDVRGRVYLLALEQPLE